MDGLKDKLSRSRCLMATKKEREYIGKIMKPYKNKCFKSFEALPTDRQTKQCID